MTERDVNNKPRHLHMTREQLQRKGQLALKAEIDRRKRLGISIREEQD